MNYIQTRVQISHGVSVFCANVKKPSQGSLQHRLWICCGKGERWGSSSQCRKHCITAGCKARALQDEDGWIHLLSQEMGEARLEIITQTFCAVKEMSSDSTKPLVSCCELRISGLPKNGQEGKGWLSPWKSLFNENASSRASRTLQIARREDGGWGEVTVVREATWKIRVWEINYVTRELHKHVLSNSMCWAPCYVPGVPDILGSLLPSNDSAVVETGRKTIFE